MISCALRRASASCVSYSFLSSAACARSSSAERMLSAILSERSCSVLSSGPHANFFRMRRSTAKFNICTKNVEFKSIICFFPPYVPTTRKGDWQKPPPFITSRLLAEERICKDNDKDNNCCDNRHGLNQADRNKCIREKSILRFRLARNTLDELCQNLGIAKNRCSRSYRHNNHNRNQRNNNW